MVKEDGHSKSKNDVVKNMGKVASSSSSASGIYLSIQSKIGCNIKIVVQSGESRNERKDTVQVEQKKTIDDLYEECDPEQIHNDLTDYLEFNYKNWDFDAIDRHKRRLQAYEFHTDVRAQILYHKRDLKSQNREAAKTRRE